jgi:hypothetical protein
MQKQIESLAQEIQDMIDKDENWKNKAKLVQSIPGYKSYNSLCDQY